MDRVSIKPLEKAYELPGALKDLDWPIELNGRGVYDKEKGEMTIRYPKGDVLLSYVTAIHEMGHLRQHEFNPELHDLKDQTHENLMAEEADAWARGWQRFAEANPERIREFEKIIQTSENAKLKDVGSFAALYQFVRDNSLVIVEMQKVLFKTGDKDKAFEELAANIKKTGWDVFLAEMKDLRIGQTVDTDQMENDVRSVMRNVIEE